MNKILLRYEEILLFTTGVVRYFPCIFNRYSLESGTGSNQNGVSDNTIYNVCYGSDGFIWLSTDKGISRYDGFRFRDYPLIMGIDSLSTPLHQAVKNFAKVPTVYIMRYFSKVELLVLIRILKSSCRYVLISLWN